MSRPKLRLIQGMKDWSPDAKRAADSVREGIKRLEASYEADRKGKERDEARGERRDRARVIQYIRKQARFWEKENEKLVAYTLVDLANALEGRKDLSPQEIARMDVGTRKPR